MAPQNTMQCPHGVHVNECDICTNRRMHYLRRIGGNNRGSYAWQTIHQNTLQNLANTIYPEGHMVHNQNIGRFLNGRMRVLITQNMRNAARNFIQSYGRESARARQIIGERFFNHSINAIENQENNVNSNFHSGNNLPSPRSARSNKSGSTRFTGAKKSPMSPGVTSRRKRR